MGSSSRGEIVLGSPLEAPLSRVRREVGQVWDLRTRNNSGWRAGGTGRAASLFSPHCPTTRGSMLEVWPVPVKGLDPQERGIPMPRHTCIRPDRPAVKGLPAGRGLNSRGGTEQPGPSKPALSTAPGCSNAQRRRRVRKGGNLLGGDVVPGQMLVSVRALGSNPVTSLKIQNGLR